MVDAEAHPTQGVKPSDWLADLCQISHLNMVKENSSDLLCLPKSLSLPVDQVDYICFWSLLV